VVNFDTKAVGVTSQRKANSASGCHPLRLRHLELSPFGLPPT